jgi:hypothetical protein
MSPIRVRATAEADGELRLRGLPIRKGQEAAVIVLTDVDDDTANQMFVSLVENDPAWAWLHDPAEDIYTEAECGSARVVRLVRGR